MVEGVATREGNHSGFAHRGDRSIFFRMITHIEDIP